MGFEKKSKQVLQAEFTQKLADWVRDCKDYGESIPQVKTELFEMIDGVPQMNIVNTELMTIVLKQALRLSFMISDNEETLSEFIHQNAG